MKAQQRAFDRFRREYNEVRPHEALGQRPPASFYSPSPRHYPSRLTEPEYPLHFEVRRVRRAGQIKWRGQTYFISASVAGAPGRWWHHRSILHVG